MRWKNRLILALIIISYYLVSGNITPAYLISEFKVDSSGWKLEIGTTFDTLRLDSTYFLTSIDDTAYFKNNLKLTFSDSTKPYGTYKIGVITNESLKTDFIINPKKDTVTFYHYERYGENADEIREMNTSLAFGYANFPPAPKQGQSICNNLDYGYFYYLDNSPTFGKENDTIDAKGQLNIHITDAQEEPLDNIYCYLFDMFLWPDVNFVSNSDSLGNIQLNLISSSHTIFFSPSDSLRDYMYFYKDQNYIKKNIVVYPDSTRKISIQIPDSVLTNISNPMINIPSRNEYRLSENYPNPFNHTTTFNYELPFADYIEINLYDIQGRLVKNVESGFRKSGRHKVNLQFSNLHSGLYFYRLETGNRTITKKCIYLK